jgi:hypothetical protein
MNEVQAQNRLKKLRELIQVDIGQRGLARDPEENLFTLFPDDFEKACSSIANHPHPIVGIVTGFMIASIDPPRGETDGPLGAYWLARLLNYLQIPNIVLTDEASGNAFHQTEVNLCRLDEESIQNIRATGDTSIGQLTHLVSIERCGPSYSESDMPEQYRNRCLSMKGIDITKFTQPAHLLFECDRKYTTIGIGDGGNEIGMGKIPRWVIKKNIPRGEWIACRITADYLITTGVSNWGAYALGAGIAILRNVPIPLDFFDPMKEQEKLINMVENGPLVDGVTGKKQYTVDGIEFSEYIKVLVEIGKI